MRTYKKKHNKNSKNNKNSKKTKYKLKGGGEYDFTFTEGISLAPSIAELVGIALRVNTLIPILEKKYKTPADFVALLPKAAEGLAKNKIIAEEIQKASGPDPAVLYKGLIEILKNIDPEDPPGTPEDQKKPISQGVSIFEETLKILCGHQETLKKILHQEKLAEPVGIIQTAMKEIAKELEKKQDELILKIRVSLPDNDKKEEIITKLSSILANVIKTLGGELDELIPIVCMLTGSNPDGSTAAGATPGAAGVAPSESGKVITKEELADLRDDKPLEPVIPGPVKVEGNKVVVNTEKIEGLLAKEDLKITNDKQQLNVKFDKHDGISIKGVKVEKSFPPSVKITTESGKNLGFILIPDSNPLRYELPSNEKITKKEIAVEKFPSLLTGTIEINESDGEPTLNAVDLKGFKLEYPEVYRLGIDDLSTFFTRVKDLKNPTYVLAESAGGKKRKTHKKHARLKNKK